MRIPRTPLALIVGTTILCATGCGAHDAAPSPEPGATNVPRTVSTIGPPTTVPWWSRGRLHVGARVIRTHLHEIVARGGTVIVGRTGDRGSRWEIVRGDRLRELVSTRSVGVRPVVSADGRHVAWVTSTVTVRIDEFNADEAFTLTGYDVGRGRVTGSTVIASRTACCDGDGGIAIAGIDDGGAVIVARYADRVWLWRPGREPVRLGRPVRPLHLPGNDQWPDGLTWSSTGDSGGPAVFAHVSRLGVVSRIGRVPQSQGGLWSPDGTSYAYAPAIKERRARPVLWHNGHARVMAAPPGAWPLAWESRHAVILVDGDTDAPWLRLVRCRVSEARCEQAGPLLHHARVADPFVF